MAELFFTQGHLLFQPLIFFFELQILLSEFPEIVIVLFVLVVELLFQQSYFIFVVVLLCLVKGFLALSHVFFILSHRSLVAYGFGAEMRQVN
jgi:hypothetical protein